MTYPEDSLQIGQIDIAERLANDDFFTDIPVVYERKGNLTQEVLQNLGLVAGEGGKCGIAVVVQQPQAKVVTPESTIPMLYVSYNILVNENVKLNMGALGTGKTCLTVARRIVNVLHNFRSPGAFSMLTADDPVINPGKPLADVAYTVRFLGLEISAGQDIQRVSQPAYNLIGNAIQLTCPTSGAAIWYTLDQTFPGPRTTTARLYAAPFNPGQAGVVRAAAYLAGSIASDITELIIT